MQSDVPMTQNLKKHARNYASLDRSLRDLPLGLVVIAVLPADAAEVGAGVLEIAVVAAGGAHRVRDDRATGRPLPTLAIVYILAAA